MVHELTYPEWFFRVCRELTLEEDSLNRLWQKFEMLCVSNGISPDMETLVWTEELKEVSLVVYHNLQKLDGLKVSFVKSENGWTSQVKIKGVLWTGE